MKPTSINNENARQVPHVDYHYQIATLTGSSCCCVKPSKSLRDISRDYFDGEANRDFIGDTALFVTLLLSVVVPIVSGASAALDLCRALPLF
jgi:hypothetical protein